MSSLRRRRRPSPAAVPPLEDENLLSEILLRLPPQPSSLPRASLVCKRWRGLVSDPGFCRRFRRRHRRNPPLLGFFQELDEGLSFAPSLKAPDRVSPERFSLQLDCGGNFVALGCRHGLVLVFLRKTLQLLVWDPVTGDQHRIAVPPGFDTDNSRISGAVFRSAGDVQHFHLALVGNSERQITQAAACVYSSETGIWGTLVTTPLLQPEDPAHFRITVSRIKPAVLVGGSLYWLLYGGPKGILEFDMGRQRLAVIPMPISYLSPFRFSMIRADGGGFGLLILSGFNAQFWKKMTNCDGVASWVLARTIEIDKLLNWEPVSKGSQVILGFAEENNVVLLWTVDGPVMLQLESLQFEEVLGTNVTTHYHSFESVYTTEREIGGDEADLLHNT